MTTLGRMFQKKRKPLCTVPKLTKLNECQCSSTMCRHSDDNNLNSNIRPGIATSQDEKTGSLEVMGILDYPSDEVAAATSMETDTADKQFIDAMQMLSQINAEEIDKDIDDMANYINNGMPKRIVISSEGG